MRGLCEVRNVKQAWGPTFRSLALASRHRVKLVVWSSLLCSPAREMDSLNMGQMMSISAVGLGLGTAFFSLFGIRADKDIFLMIGLVACVLGDFAFVMCA